MDDKDVTRHYTVGDLEQRILAGLTAAGKDIDALTPEDLAPVDAFHIRGRAATEGLAALARIGPGDRLLDVGCGLGGTARTLAAAFGCHVTGVDLTAEYCRVAAMLSARVGLFARTDFRAASALALPFDAGSFDIVWTEHVQMNIADKAAFYGELTRVLRPGGQLVFHDVFRGSGGVELFPVPWASEPSISHLAEVDEIQALLAALGLAVVAWEDTSAASAEFFDAVLARVTRDGWMPLGLHLLMGDDALEKFGNLARNLSERRVRVMQAVLRKP